MRPGWGLMPAPGKAQVYVYPDCKDGRVVADVVRIDKGHTEGLEPKVTEELIKMMLSGERRQASTAPLLVQFQQPGGEALIHQATQNKLAG